MRALTIQEVDEVSGGSYLSDVTGLATQTGFIGSIVGYAVTGTAAGATTGGWWGAGFGAAWGGLEQVLELTFMTDMSAA